MDDSRTRYYNKSRRCIVNVGLTKTRPVMMERGEIMGLFQKSVAYMYVHVDPVVLDYHPWGGQMTMINYYYVD